MWPTIVGIKQYYHIMFPKPEWQLVPTSAAALAAPVAALMLAQTSTSTAAYVETQLADAMPAGMAPASLAGPARGACLTDGPPVFRSSLAEAAITAANAQLDAEALLKPVAQHVSCKQLEALLRDRRATVACLRVLLKANAVGCRAECAACMCSLLRAATTCLA